MQSSRPEFLEVNLVARGQIIFSKQRNVEKVNNSVKVQRPYALSR
jgi:hypothetical protein